MKTLKFGTLAFLFLGLVGCSGEIAWKTDGSEAYTNLAYNCIKNLKKCTALEQSSKERETIRCEMHYKPKHS